MACADTNDLMRLVTLTENLVVVLESLLSTSCCFLYCAARSFAFELPSPSSLMTFRNAFSYSSSLSFARPASSPMSLMNA